MHAHSGFQREIAKDAPWTHNKLRGQAVLGWWEVWKEGKAACEAKHGWHSPLGRKLFQGAEPGAYLAPAARPRAALVLVCRDCVIKQFW